MVIIHLTSISIAHIESSQLFIVATFRQIWYTSEPWAFLLRGLTSPGPFPGGATAVISCPFTSIGSPTAACKSSHLIHNSCADHAPSL